MLEKCPEKLVAQTYDGAAVFRGKYGGVNVKIKEVYNNAHYIYCYAHQLNKLLEQAASHISSVRAFFCNLKGISAFFSNSPERTASFEKICHSRIPKPSDTRWAYRSRIIQSVHRNKASLEEYFENVLNGKPRSFNAETTR